MTTKKSGRPFVYQAEDERPVTVSLRVPRDLYEQVQRYVHLRPQMTMTEFLLDAARLKLETPTDPRDLSTLYQRTRQVLMAHQERPIYEFRW